MVYYILLSGFMLFFSRICWKLEYIYLRGWLDLVRKYVDLVRKYVEGVRYKS